MEEEEVRFTEPLTLYSLDCLARHLASCLLQRTVAEQRTLLDQLCQALVDGDVANSMVRYVRECMGAAGSV